MAVVQDGKIAYVQAYGSARLDPQTTATAAMRYSIGSISKQFTAAAMLMLAEEGKLSLDDPVSKYVPGLTEGDQVTIRELLSHTSGYQDFWPQDYVPPLMLKPITADQIMDMWARKPLDFQPGTKWQYSNTNYVIAGAIVEKVSGMPLLEFLSQRVFTPLGMKSVADTDANKLPPTDPSGYFRYALGPLHPAPKEGRGWMFAAGELAMTAEDLAKWDISIIDQSCDEAGFVSRDGNRGRAEEWRRHALRVGRVRHQQQRPSRRWSMAAKYPDLWPRTSCCLTIRLPWSC